MNKFHAQYIYRKLEISNASRGLRCWLEDVCNTYRKCDWKHPNCSGLYYLLSMHLQSEKKGELKHKIRDGVVISYLMSNRSMILLKTCWSTDIHILSWCNFSFNSMYLSWNKKVKYVQSCYNSESEILLLRIINKLIQQIKCQMKESSFFFFLYAFDSCLSFTSRLQRKSILYQLIEENFFELSPPKAPL